MAYSDQSWTETEFETIMLYEQIVLMALWGLLTEITENTSASLNKTLKKTAPQNLNSTSMPYQSCILVFPKGYSTSRVVFLGQLQIITQSVWRAVL